MIQQAIHTYIRTYNIKRGFNFRSLYLLNVYAEILAIWQNISRPLKKHVHFIDEHKVISTYIKKLLKMLLLLYCFHDLYVCENSGLKYSTCCYFAVLFGPFVVGGHCLQSLQNRCAFNELPGREGKSCDRDFGFLYEC